ncbi:hypothetical protein [Porphyromonas pogonae]|uniref:hypothetical protein n=1 Tax=Porphyromonas pogonae TaxID=867595 RepID=UPI0038B545B5
MKTNIVEIFCFADDFSKLFDTLIQQRTISEGNKKRRNRKFNVNSELVLFIDFVYLNIHFIG